MSKKLIWILTGIAVLIVVLVVAQKNGAFGKDEGIKVTAEKVQKRTIIETVSASGKVYPEVEVKVSPDISGEICGIECSRRRQRTKGPDARQNLC